MSSNADAAHFRRACSKYATGVAVVTVLDKGGMPLGMTVNSFTSVSLEPPLVLICVDNRAAILEHLLAAEMIGINVLAESQGALSVRFARPGEDRFGAVEWVAGESGVPVIPGVLAVFECAITQVVAAGDHQVFLAEARFVSWREDKPLLYFASAYQALA